MNHAIVQRAIAEMLNEGFMASEIVRTLKNTAPDLRPQAFESMRPERSVPDGCFEWAHHLIWLDELRDVAPVALTAEEAQGLMALKRERARFRANHPPCPKCGMPNVKEAFTCQECFTEIPKG